jgi:hypothetical protein
MKLQLWPPKIEMDDFEPSIFILTILFIFIFCTCISFVMKQEKTKIILQCIEKHTLQECNQLIQ